jgi:hypothetical protein
VLRKEGFMGLMGPVTFSCLISGWSIIMPRAIRESAVMKNV